MSKIFSIRLTKELYDKCKVLAEEDDRSFSNFIVLAIKEKIKRVEEKNMGERKCVV